jgi:ubiquinone/menaquinone biosynthesis C-methylase UbiE
MERLIGAQELLDGPLDPAALSGNLDDLSRVNRWLGGAALSRRAIVALAGNARDERPIELLDVGTGAADIPAALIGWFKARGVTLSSVAIDTRMEIIEEARRRTRRVAGLTVEHGSGSGLPYADGAFTVAHCSMVLHHLEAPDACAVLREMARVSRLGVVVNDLDRTVRFWLGARVLGALTTRNRYTRADGPLSVRRAYRPDEMIGLAKQAGLAEAARFIHPLGYRYAFALVPDGA